MKVAIIRGNPRKSGITQKLADIFAEGARNSGASIADIDLTKINLNPCIGCFSCVSKGACILNDDMANVLESVLEADALACFTPLYFYSMSSHAKIFFDRCFPLAGGNFHSAKHAGARGIKYFAGKKFAAVSVSAGRSIEAFSGLSATWRLIAKYLGFDGISEIRRGESPYFGSLGSGSARVAKILSAFRAAGESFGQSGIIPSDICAAAEAHISRSETEFAERSEKYWALLRAGRRFGS